MPLEAEEYPLYRPPSRIGCSGLTVVALVTVFAFAFLLWRVTPPIAEGIISVPRNILAGNGLEPDSTPGAGGLPTYTPLVTQVPTEPPPTATPRIDYVQLANTNKQGVNLREQPRRNSRIIVHVDEGAKFMIIGEDVKNAEGTWRHVELPNDGRKGYILQPFLVPTTWP